MKQVKQSFLITVSVMSVCLLIMSLLLGMYNMVIGFIGLAVTIVCLGLFTVVYFGAGLWTPFAAKPPANPT